MGEHARPDERETGLVKLTTRLEPSEWYSYVTETLWAEPLEGGSFRILNVPFYAKGLSFGDVVSVQTGEWGREIERVEARGGHSTYRLFLAGDYQTNAWLRYWEPLEGIGCTYERGTERLFAIDVPPGADIHEAYRLLDAGEQAGVWGFEEGDCGHALRE